MKIALTGGIGSGKSTAAKYFEDLGFKTIDLDAISKNIMQKNSKVYFNVIALFGDKILDKNGNIDRKALKEIVFDNEIKRKALEAIVHPAIFAEERTLRKLILSQNPNACIITEASLMIETGHYKQYDLLILIHADKDVQLSRVKIRDNISEELINLIIKAQMPAEEKTKYADIIIDNNTDIKTLQFDVERAATLIYEMIYAKKHKK